MPVRGGSGRSLYTRLPVDEWALPTWTDPHAFPKSDSDPRDPLRAQASIDALANGLFHSSIETGPGLTT